MCIFWASVVSSSGVIIEILLISCKYFSTACESLLVIWVAIFSCLICYYLFLLIKRPNQRKCLFHNLGLDTVVNEKRFLKVSNNNRNFHCSKYVPQINYLITEL